MPFPAHIADSIKSIPEKIGVYQYYDKKEALLYVGKAKNLKKRVASYFSKKQEYGKTKALVSRIQHIKYVTFETDWKVNT